MHALRTLIFGGSGWLAGKGKWLSRSFANFLFGDYPLRICPSTISAELARQIRVAGCNAHPNRPPRIFEARSSRSIGTIGSGAELELSSKRVVARRVSEEGSGGRRGSCRIGRRIRTDPG